MTDHPDDKIRQRAYQLGEEQGRPEGKHAEHWQQATDESASGETPPHRLQEDPAEGDRDTIERELDRQDSPDNSAGA